MRRLIILPLTIALLIMINALPAVASNDKYAVEELALQSRGLNLHLSRVSLSNDEVAKDILLMHGLTYSSHVFDVDYKDYSLVKFLARQGYNVWRLDLTGYGQSDKISDGLSVNS
ncbi:MAG: alpha/beta hydrolase, partial [Selenomonadaceae bacterium]|nr:alpha/beta hydrolase [Selenomonadaceae bacterium]